MNFLKFHLRNLGYSQDITCHACTRGRVPADLPYNVSCRLWFAPFDQGLKDKNCFEISATLHHGGDFGKASMIISCSVHLKIKGKSGQEAEGLKSRNPCAHNRQGRQGGI